MERVNNKKGGILFIDAPGGTGKTFLINLLLANIRKDKHIALAMASSGIAATLMTGGRTAHSTLQLPLDLIRNETPVCNIKKGTGKAKILQQSVALFWDEVPMIHRHALEALNRTLKDLRDNDKLMGGLTVVLAGDFRQTLPIIPRGTMYDEIKACIKNSILWSSVKVIKLEKNMRVREHHDYNAQLFSQYLLSIGNGTLKETEGTGKVKLLKDFCNISTSITNLIDSIYPDLSINIHNHDCIESAWMWVYS